MELIEVEVHNYQIKKQNLKIQFITFTDQLKFNKNEDFYKADFFKLLFFIYLHIFNLYIL